MSKIFFVTAEKSGNDIAFPIIKKLAENNTIRGVGDDRFDGMENVTIVQNSDSLAVMGFFEVIKQYKRIMKIYDNIVNEIVAFNPDVLVLFDAPSLNFKIAKAVREKISTKILGVVSPTVWIWKYKRIYKVRDLYDNMACILPFEKKIYDDENIRAEYIGHPLLKNFHITTPTTTDEIIGILPGSRAQEIEKHIAEFKKVIQYFQGRGYKGKFLVSKMPHLNPAIFEQLSDLDNIEFETESSTKVMEKSSFLFVKSGTITLQALLSKKPFLIFYKTSAITYFIANMFFKGQLRAIGLPNIIAKKLVIPEYIQKWDYENIYNNYRKYRDDIDSFYSLYDIAIKELGEKDYIVESCKLIDNLIEERND